MVTESDERALFEAWAKRRGHDVVSQLETGGKIYVSSFTREAWDIWQARAAIAPAFMSDVAIPAKIDLILEEAEQDNRYGGSEDSEGSLMPGVVDWQDVRAKIMAVFAGRPASDLPTTPQQGEQE